MGAALKAAGLFRTSNDYYAKALQQAAIKADAAKREAILTAMGSSYLEIREGRLASSTYTRCLKEFTGSPHKLEWQLNLGRAYALEDKDKARRYLEAFIRDHPGTPESSTAERLLGGL
jgi:outer membrane protein assembly factor BamD (BamD/ComL family)